VKDGEVDKGIGVIVSGDNRSFVVSAGGGTANRGVVGGRNVGKGWVCQERECR